MGERSFVKGQMLIEILVAIGIFALVGIGLATLLLDSFVTLRLGKERTQAIALAEEGLEAARSIRNQNWALLANGFHGVSSETGTWTLKEPFDRFGTFFDAFIRIVSIEAVQRDASGNVVSSGGTVDANTKQIHSVVLWQFGPLRIQVVELATYLTNWLGAFWHQTLKAEFDGGRLNSTETQETGDGEVAISAFGDWAEPRIQQSLNLPGDARPNDIFFHEDYVYIVTKINPGPAPEFFAYDVSDVSRGIVTLVASRNLDTNANAVYAAGKRIYIATADNARELIILRAGDFAEAGSYDLPGNADALSVYADAQGMVYVGRDRNLLEEFYVLDAKNLKSISTALKVEVNGRVEGIAVSGGYAFITSNRNRQELRVIDLAGGNILYTADLPGGADPTDIVIQDDIAYVTRRNNPWAGEFFALDIENLLSKKTKIIGSVELGATVHALSLDAGRAFVATDSDAGELAVIDTKNFSIIGKGNAAGGGNAFGVSSFGSFAYLITGTNSNEFQVFFGPNAGGWENPRLVGDYDISGSANARDIVVAGNTAYIITDENPEGEPEFYIIDITDPQNPKRVGSLDLKAQPNALAVSGNYAYIATSDDASELLIVDIAAKPLSIAQSFNVPRGADGLSVFVSGKTVYLGTRNNPGKKKDEFYIIDASKTEDPTLLGSYPVNTDVESIVVSDGLAYLATSSDARELVILDVSNPSEILPRGSYNKPGRADAYDIALFSHFAILVAQDGGRDDDFYILDVTNPGLITREASLDLKANQYGVVTDGAYAFVSGNRTAGQVQIVDISNISSPFFLSSFDLGGTGRGISLLNGLVYAATAANAREMQIVGPSAVAGELARDGMFVSSSFDSGSAGTAWQTISWTAQIPIGTSIKFRIRTADTQANLSQAIWVGADGTAATFYENAGAAVIIDPQATGTRWIQYKAYLFGDGGATPILEDVTLGYQ